MPATSLKLKTGEWRIATWRPIPPVPRPKVREFDFDTLVEKQENAFKPYPWKLNFSAIPDFMTGEEAHFWLATVSLADSHRWTTSDISQELSDITFQESPSISTIRQYMQFNSLHRIPAEIVIVLLNLVEPATVLTLLQKSNLTRNKYLEVFRQHIFNYMTDTEKSDLRSAIQADVEANYQNPPDQPISPALIIGAATGGFSEQLEIRLQAFPNHFYKDRDYTPYGLIEIILGLDSPERVEHHMRRLPAYLFEPIQVKGWLAHTEINALDWITRSIQRETTKTTATGLLREIAAIKHPAITLHMLTLSQESIPEIRMKALEWLSEHEEITIHGLTTVAETSEAARQYLQRLAHQGKLSLIRKRFDDLQIAEETREMILQNNDSPIPEFDDNSTPEWLQIGVQEIEKRGTAKPAAAWIQTIDLPPIVVGEHRLNYRQINTVLHALKHSDFTHTPDLIIHLRENADRITLEAFVWQLFEGWLNTGATSKDKWALLATGYLGNDNTVLKLTPMIKRWPGERQHQRAVLGIKCLMLIGSNTALMQINNIARTARYKGLKQEANHALQFIARQLNLSEAELGDRIVPHCGLAANGQRVFDYGTRQFTLHLNPELKPLVYDEKGKSRASLPRPGKKDDDALAVPAYEAWKIMKKQIREVVKLQSSRLETAMVNQRRWSFSDFEQYLLNHPLMSHLIRSILWGMYDDDNRLRYTFRITDEKDFSNEHDDDIMQERNLYPGIVHPIEVDEVLRSEWLEIFRDYEIISPFPQINRDIYTPHPEDLKENIITRFAHIAIHPAALVGSLEQHGWQRGAAGDAGVYHTLSRHFPQIAAQAVIQFGDGIPYGLLKDWDNQQIEACYFLPQKFHPDTYNIRDKILTIKDIPRVIISEVLRDLEFVASKGETD